MSDFMLEKLGKRGIFAVFHQDAGEGFFFLYRSEAHEVLVQERVYEREPKPPLTEDDVLISWPTDDQASLALRGTRMCLIDAVTMTVEYVSKSGETVAPKGTGAPALAAFRSTFKDHRKEYWRSKVNQ